LDMILDKEVDGFGAHDVGGRFGRGRGRGRRWLRVRARLFGSLGSSG
jgi:hypothetical protein